jgi:hypothetical protein
LQILIRSKNVRHCRFKLTRFFLVAVLASLSIGWASSAQQTPLSAIDWLSESVAVPSTVAPDGADVAEDDTAEFAGTETIETTRLDAVSKNGVGLFPPSQSGLPKDFWGSSSQSAVAHRINRLPSHAIPAVHDLIYTVLLAELDPPQDGKNDSGVLLARLDKLLEYGALDQALALVERAGPDQTQIFRRWFDINLLIGRADHACSALAAAPEFNPTVPAKVFCLARNGDWNAAALTLGTAEALGFIETDKADLLARFLDPQMFDGQPDLPVPNRMTVLEFVLREAIGQPRPTHSMPLAFAFPDLQPLAGWRSQIDAAERLSVTGAVQPGQLFGIYSGKSPAASGGIWDRVAAVQAFDVALLSSERKAIEETLPTAMKEMASVGLEVAFALFFADRLLTKDIAKLKANEAEMVVLLSASYEKATLLFGAEGPNALAKAIARGRNSSQTSSAVEAAVSAGFSGDDPTGEIYDIYEKDALGEAVLLAASQLADGPFSDPGDIEQALKFLRLVGFEDAARRIALQILLLERRG